MNRKKQLKFLAGCIALVMLIILLPGAAMGAPTPPLGKDPNPQILKTKVIWSGNEFTEASTNQGAIGNVITVTLDGPGTFNGTDDQVFPESSYTANNIPEGLQLNIYQVDSTTVRISLSGNAVNHLAINSISDLEIDLSGIITDYIMLNGAARNDLKVTFTGFPIFEAEPVLPPLLLASGLSWSGDVFMEAGANDGTISGSILVTANNEINFAGVNGEIYELNNQYTVANLPPGLSVKATKINLCTVKLELTGTANHHEADDSIDNLTISFTDAGIVNPSGDSVLCLSKNNIKIEFEDAREDIPNDSSPGDVTPDDSTPVDGSIHAVISIGSLIYTVNDEQFTMDAVPYISNDRTYVPVRYLAYALGLTADDISWNGTTRTVTIVDTGSSTTITLTIGSKTLFVNGTATAMDVAPEITNDRTMLPARWVAEALGAAVGWDPTTSTVIIDKLAD